MATKQFGIKAGRPITLVLLLEKPMSLQVLTVGLAIKQHAYSYQKVPKL